MRTLTAEQRQKGRERGLESMTAAQRVQRRLNAGRRPALPESLSLLEAVKRLADEADRAKSTMADEQLDPEDIHLALLFSAKDDAQEYLGYRRLGPPDEVGAFVTGLEKLAGVSKLTFLGIVWSVYDREAEKGLRWARTLVAGEEAEERVQLAKGLFTAPHRPN